MKAVRRLSRKLYSDVLVCVCGALVPFGFVGVVGERTADVYTLSVCCKACSAVWGVQLCPRSVPHLRVQRLDRSPP